jgi:hypothetical protein
MSTRPAGAFNLRRQLREEGDHRSRQRKDYIMPIGGNMPGAGANNTGGLGGGPNTNGSNGPKTNGGSNNGGKTPEGVPVNPAKPRLPSIPDLGHAPDTNGGATVPAPVDLSLLAGPTDLPQRKPLHNAAVSVPQTGVTGYAGVFIP